MAEQEPESDVPSQTEVTIFIYFGPKSIVFLVILIQKFITRARCHENWVWFQLKARLVM